jgi:DNA-binding GntR family transcriptional regulator
MELYEIREVLEAKAAALCATHATDLEIAVLRELVSREQRLRDPDELARHNRVFHEAVHQGAHNRYLTRTLSTLNDSMWLLGPSLMRLTERARTALKDHASLFAAIEKRDPKAAEAAARAHVRGAKQQRMRTLFPQSSARETL